MRSWWRLSMVVALVHLSLIVAMVLWGRPRTADPPQATIRVNMAALPGESRAMITPSASASRPPESVIRPAESVMPAAPTMGSRPSPTMATGPESVPLAVGPSSATGATGFADRDPMVDASYGGNRAPEYPALSRRLGEQGAVVLRVLITVDGRASEVMVLKSSGSARLDEAAKATIRDWRFVPAVRGTRPVPAWYEWRWEFRLSG